MKTWLKSFLAVSTAWLIIGLILDYLGMAEFKNHNALTLLFAFASGLVLSTLIIFMTVYVVKRSDFSTLTRVLWVISFWLVPIQIASMPIFFVRYILAHPSDRPILDPMRFAP